MTAGRGVVSRHLLIKKRILPRCALQPRPMAWLLGDAIKFFARNSAHLYQEDEKHLAQPLRYNECILHIS